MGVRTWWRSALTVALVLPICATLWGQPFVNTVVPQPSFLRIEEGAFPITSQFSLAAPGYHDDRLYSGIERMLNRLEMQTGMQLAGKSVTNGPGPSVVVIVAGPGEAIQGIDEDESYTLTVTSRQVVLKASTVVGALRGMETLLQLVQSNDREYFLPSVTIHDTPRFVWRGLLIDSGRHFEPVPVIRRTLDGMAAVKLNVLHWHLTEDQGFRVESRVFPRLAGEGSDGLFYTQEDVKEIVQYARDRGIRVVPEFDMPGHSRSWFVGYPDLASAPGPYTIRREFGIEDAAMDPTRESTFEFIEKFIHEMAALFPDPYMHIGGDESNGSQWKTNPRIVKFMKQQDIKDTVALQTYFNQHLLAILKKNGKHMVGWDEILTPALPNDVVVQSWRGAKALADAAVQGNMGILSAPYYLNHMGTSEKFYLTDPEPASVNLTTEQRKLILGGEACMWGEYVFAETIDSRLWPRTAAIAERFWSPKDVRDVDDLYRRLDVMSVRLEALGLTHIAHENAALRGLILSGDIQPLQVLASIVEPDDDNSHHETITLTPLDHFSDAVLPDPPSRRTLQSALTNYLQNPATHVQERAYLRTLFLSWTAAAQELQVEVQRSPRLAETRVRAHQMLELAMIGQSALGYLETGEHAPAGWKQARLTTLNEAQKQSASVRFVVLEPLKQMIGAVQEQP